MISCFDAGRLVFANLEWQRVLGWTLEEARHPRFLEWAYPDPAERQRVLDVIREGDPVWNEFRTRTRDGRIVETTWTRTILSDGTSLGFGMDITDRKRSEAALRESEKRLRAVFDSALDSILVVDDDGRYLDANPAAQALLGRDSETLRELSVAETTAPGFDFPTAWATLHREGSLKGEWGFLRPDGSVRHVEFSSSSNFQPGRHLGVLRDITDRKALEAAVRAGETHLREGERLSHTGSWAWHVPSGSLFWSAEMYRILGLDPSAVAPTHSPLLPRIHPEDRPRVRSEVESALAAKRGFGGRFRALRPDGSIRHVHSVAHPTFDEAGDILEYVGVVMDVTEQHLADQRLQQSFVELQGLTERLRGVREEERSRIAREVHDEIGQSLTALRMDVDWLRKKLPGDVAHGIAERLDDMSALTETTLDAVQRIASELRPAILDELGLEAAVEWFTRDFEKRTGVVSRVEARLGDTAVDPARSTAAFRVLQEALTNVARHSGATTADVRVATETGRLVLEVRDNGRGIPADRLADLRSLGLIGMRERARSLGGDVDFRASPGKGTTISLTVPL